MAKRKPKQPNLTKEDQYNIQLYDDPLFFSEQFLPEIISTNQQIEIFNAVRDSDRVSIRSGNGIGKTNTLSRIMLWYLLARDDVKVVCTAPTFQQLKSALWAELSKMYAMFPEFAKDELSFGNQRIYKKSEPSSFIELRTTGPGRTEALSGIHAKHVLLIFDEASGVLEDVFVKASGSMSTAGAKTILISNPTRIDGYFFDTHNKFRDRWKTLQFSGIDSPLVSEEFIKEKEQDYGRDSDIFKVMVLGEFPSRNSQSLIPYDSVEQAFRRSIDPREVEHCPILLGCDPGYTGNDKSAVFMRQGRYGKVVFSGQGLNGEELARKVVSISQQYHSDYIFVDMTGIGTACFEFVRGVCNNVYGIHFAQQATNNLRFTGIRSEMWWKLAEWIKNDLPAIEQNQDLLSDLTGPEYGFNGKGQMYLESKQDMRKRGLHSPDHGDSAALTFSVPTPVFRNEMAMGNIIKTFSGGFNDIFKL